MYKRLAAVALAGFASAVPAVVPYPRISVCTETSTLIYRSTTEYSTYYVTHTLDASEYPAPTGSGGPAPPYDSSSSTAGPAPTGSYPAGPATSVTDVTTVYTTTCPAVSTYTRGDETLTSTYSTVSTLTSTYQSTITASAYGPSSSPTSPVTTRGPYTSICTETSTLIHSNTTKYSTYLVTHTAYPAGPGVPTTTVTDVTTVYTTTCPVSSVYTSDTSELTSYYTTVSTLTSTYQSTITEYPTAPATSPSLHETTGAGQAPAPYPPGDESSPVAPEPVDDEAPPASYPSGIDSSPVSPEDSGGAQYGSTPDTSAPSPDATTQAGGIGSYIANPTPNTSPLIEETHLPPVVPYPVPSSNGTAPGATGLPSSSTTDYPAQQTGNSGTVCKPIGALLGLAGLAVALL